MSPCLMSAICYRCKGTVGGSADVRTAKRYPLNDRQEKWYPLHRAAEPVFDIYDVLPD